MNWTANFAYAVGLIVSDGNLSKNKRGINFTSKDIHLALTFRAILKPNCSLSKKSRISGGDRKYYLVQFSDVKLYCFLESIGIHPQKSKTIESVELPNVFFIDFLRGCIDGDGTITVAKHPESKYPQLRLRLASGSYDFLSWIKMKINSLFGITGGFILKCGNGKVYQLTYAKADSLKLLDLIYYLGVEYYLPRKHLRWVKFKAGMV